MKTVSMNLNHRIWNAIMEKNEETTLSNVKKNSLILMLFTFISRLLGIVRARVVATFFGASGVGDVINFTFNIPNNFRKLFAEGAFNSAFIPVFTRLIVTPDRQKELLRTLAGFQIAIMSPIIILTYLFRTQVITFFSDFSDPSLILLASHLLPLFMIYLALIAFYALLIGVLQSHNLFVTAAIAPLIFSITVIASIILFSSTLGPYSFVLGVIVGGILQTGFTFIRVKRLTYDAHITFNFTNKDFIDVMRRWGPVTISAIITIIGQQIAFYLASTLETGSVTYFSNAIIIWQAPYGIFFGAIATSIFPSLVIAGSNKNKVFMKRLTTHGLISLLALLLPALLLLTIVGDQTSVVLLTSGKYTLQDALRTSDVLFFYALSMPIAAWYTFLQRVSYSIDDFTPSLIITSIVALIDIISMIILLRVRGVVSSISLASIISFSIGLIIYVVYLLKRDVLNIINKEFITHIMKIGLSNIPLAMFLWYMNTILTPALFLEVRTIVAFLLLSALYIAAIMITYLAYRIAHIDVMGLFKKK